MAATCGWTRGLHEIKHDGGSCKREPAPQLAQPKNHVDELERNTRMSRLLVKCALLAAAIAGVAAMAGLEMHAIIILIVVGLCILVGLHKRFHKR